MNVEERKTLQMLLRGGILPRNAIEQLVQQGQLSNHVLDVFGTEKIPDTKEGREEWARKLKSLLAEEEVELVRETQLDSPSEDAAVDVWVYEDEEALRGQNRGKAVHVPAILDAASKFLFLSDNEYTEAIDEGSCIEYKVAGHTSLFEVTSADVLYDGETPRFLACTAKPLLP